MGVAHGIIEKSGAWFYYDGNRLAQGRDNAREALENDPSLMAALEEKIRQKSAEEPTDGFDEALPDALDDEEDGELDGLDIRLLDLGTDE